MSLTINIETYNIVLLGPTVNGEIQSERLLLALPSISAVACLLDYMIKLQHETPAGWSSIVSRMAIALAGCAQRSSLSILFIPTLVITVIH